jgi:hypothetical protein
MDVYDRLKAEQDLCVEELYEHLRGVVWWLRGRLTTSVQQSIASSALCDHLYHDPDRSLQKEQGE